MPAISTDRALQSAFAPIRDVPTPSTLQSVGTTPQLFVPSLAGDAVRRMSVVNRSATGTLAVVFTLKGVAVGAATVASGRPIPPGSTWEFTVVSYLDVYVVADAAANAYGGIAADF